jgi:hypothetical protein
MGSVIKFEMNGVGEELTLSTCYNSTHSPL